MNYLYNGVELPALTSEVNTNTYPYVFLTTDEYQGITYYKAIYSENPAVVVSVSDDMVEYNFGGIETRKYVYAYADNETIASYYDGEVGKWNSGGSAPCDADWLGDCPSIIWSNYNVLKTDGSVHLAASEPTPAGDSPSGTFTIDQASFLAGYKAGAELRRLRS